MPAALSFEKLRPPEGIYNCTNPGSITTREICELLAATIAPGRVFDFFSDEDEFMRTSAITPRSNCVLDPSKILSIGIRLAPIREATSAALRGWQPSSQP